MAAGAQRRLLLAASQGRVRSRRRRLVAGSRRRARRAVAAQSHPHVLGRLAALAARTNVRSRCIATATPGCRATARSSGRATSTRRWETLKTHVPVAINTGLSGIPYWGTDIGGFVPTPEFTGELYVRWFQFAAFCPLFRSHGRTWHLRLPWGWNTGELGPDETATYQRRRPSARRGAAQRAGRADLPEVSRAALPPDAVPLFGGARDDADRAADHARAVAALSRRSDRRRPRRPVPLGPRHPRRAGGREGRDVAPPLSAARHLVRLLDGGDGSTAAARSIAPVDLATMPLYVRAGAIIPMGPVKQYTAEPVDGPLTRHGLSRRRRHVRAVRGRRAIVRVPAGRLDGHHLPLERSRSRLSLSLTPGSRMRPPLVRDDRQVRVAGTQTVKFSGAASSVRRFRLKAEARSKVSAFGVTVYWSRRSSRVTPLKLGILTLAVATLMLCVTPTSRSRDRGAAAAARRPHLLDAGHRVLRAERLLPLRQSRLERDGRSSTSSRRCSRR